MTIPELIANATSPTDLTIVFRKIVEDTLQLPDACVVDVDISQWSFDDKLECDITLHFDPEKLGEVENVLVQSQSPSDPIEPYSPFSGTIARLVMEKIKDLGRPDIKLGNPMPSFDKRNHQLFICLLVDINTTPDENVRAIIELTNEFDCISNDIGSHIEYVSEAVVDHNGLLPFEEQMDLMDECIKTITRLERSFAALRRIGSALKNIESMYVQSRIKEHPSIKRSLDKDTNVKNAIAERIADNKKAAQQ